MSLAFFGLLAIGGQAWSHSGPLNTAALEVCQEKSRSQACQYHGHHNDLYIGTCQYVSDEDLICVRNKPVQKLDPAQKNSGENPGEKENTN
ncbi:hypothetical protein [Marinobacter sp. F3R08]|uniref:hypothetical protein n=1 Tax=Marinobacter sp. F3R08 TaxID=2841559 RepID=UPI001C082774|nr:hypothetical protein [Marinobacter sp. F3R08]MBU2952676.1 hypothetical protein [Marinobacter sp. F3R08]